VKDYYKILGVSLSASEDRIRRAYRTLARRYHPDVNPTKESTERFKDIAEAYRVLSDAQARKKYDAKLALHLERATHAKLRAYQQAAEKRAVTEKYYEQQKRDLTAIKAWQTRLAANKVYYPLHLKSVVDWLRRGPKQLKALAKTAFCHLGQMFKKPQDRVVSRVSVIDLPLTLKEAIYGVKKEISLKEPGGERRVKVSIPAGVRTGSIVRLKSSSSLDEEMILVVRLEKHPAVSIDQQGLTVEIPVTIHEAISGASIKVPGLEEEIIIKLPPNTQSGTRIRVKGKGLPGKEKEEAGDLFVRILVRVPESEYAVGLKEKSAELDLYYEKPVRENLPKTLLETWP